MALGGKKGQLTFHTLKGCTSGAPTTRAYRQRYTTSGWLESWVRVLCHNPARDDAEARAGAASCTGPSGHLERANAWTHLIGTVVFLMYAAARTVVFDRRAGGAYKHDLQTASVVAIAGTFTASVLFHVYSTVVGCATVVRTLDYTAIYIAMAVSATADLALVTDDFRNVDTQTILDPTLAAFALVAYFLLHRVAVPSDETSDSVFDNASSRGLFRYFHSDLEHSELRTVGVGTITASWILMVPAAVESLEPVPAAVWIIGVASSTLLLAVGLLVDTAYATDMAWGLSEQDARRCARWWACADKHRGGCLMTSHAWWHVISMISTTVMVAAREIAIQI